ncbi:MAG: hypothetical protein GOVbin2006_30 [Prokaryotic dsDNA virus sp.]|nr:MAG: hypothetical protein GOVbin2006_30 [Prokaryotic dsDNA virus sp.]|tara:strand:- start:730 stop:1260 length:531 start_codon:yes stop_codon:yes gene_type:complete
MKLKTSQIQSNKQNPRIIKEEKFKKLVQSIKEFPKMLEIRPIVVDENNIILGGNMRFEASKEAGLTEVPVKVVKTLSEEEKQEFIIKDNLSFGEWDWNIIGNEWNENELGEWGMDVWQPDNIDFEPSLNPDTKYSEITQKEIEEEAKRLAVEMIRESKNVDVICPECGHEFEIQIK